MYKNPINSAFQLLSRPSARRIVLLCTTVAFLGTTNANAQIDSKELTRVQVRVHTTDQSDAGTDAPVWVQLTESSDDRFWLNKGGDDRQRNKYESWDVVLENVRLIGGITRLQFGIVGRDSWAFDHVQIIVNNVSTAEPDLRRVIYEQRGSFAISNKPEHQRLGVPNELMLANTRTLREHSMWNLNEPRGSLLGVIPIRIPRDVLEASIEAAIGDRMGPTGEYANLKWGQKKGRSHVEISKKTGSPRNEVHVDLDLNLQGRTSRFRAVDFDFTLAVSASDGALTLTANGLDPDLSRLLKGATFGIGVLGETVVESFLPGVIVVAKIDIPPRVVLNPWFDDMGNLRVN